MIDAILGLPFLDFFKIAKSLEEKGDINASIALYRKWLPNNANAHLSAYAWFEYGRLLQQTGDVERAAFAYEASLEQKIDYTEAALALGYLLEHIDKHQEAINIWTKCIGAGGDKVKLFNNIGRVCDAPPLNDYQQAESALTQSLQVNPDQEDVIKTLLFIRQRLCRWPITLSGLGIKSETLPRYFGPLASLAIFDEPEKNLESAKDILKQKGVLNCEPNSIEKRKAIKGQKLKIGFLSADFRLHATSVFFAPMFSYLDRNQFETYGLDITVTKESFGSVREEIINRLDHHIPLQSLESDEAVNKIRSLQLDIVVDMAGLTAGARPEIVAKRVAPVQIAYLGFIGSSGIAAIDYILTTKDMFIDSHRSGYTEHPLYLSGAYVPLNDDLVPHGCRALTKVECGLPANKFIYCALVNSYKITSKIFDCWLEILKKTNESVLWLVGDHEAVIGNLHLYAASKGVDATRLVFLKKRVHPQLYREHLRCADLFLDTSPYGNGATARDAILAGLPILTCPGKTMMSRFSAHLMGQLNMDDFVVNSFEEYVEFAVTLGNYPELIEDYKSRMLKNLYASDISKTEVFASQFSEALMTAYNF